MNKIILVESRNDLKIERILKRDSTDFDSVKKRMDSQSSDSKNKNYVDYIIENNEYKCLPFLKSPCHKDLLHEI